MSAKLPIEASVTDTFRQGPHKYGLGHLPKDELESMLINKAHSAELTALQAAGAIYGAHAPQRLFRERELVSHSRRLPGTGLTSSMLSLELLMGTEDRINLGEFYHMPNPTDIGDRLSIHERVEAARQ